MQEPYVTPKAQLREERPVTRWYGRIAKFVAVIGALIGWSVVFGFLVSIFKFLVLLFSTAETGTGDSTVMVDGISGALVPLLIGYMTGMLGLLINLIAVLLFGYRAKWFFVSSIGQIFLYFLLFPVGTLLSGTLLAVLLWKREEFFPDSSQSAQSDE